MTASAPLKPWQVDRRRIVADDRRLDELAEEAKRVASEVLESAGYHRHDRGEWRLMRRPKAENGEAVGLSRLEREEVSRGLEYAASRARRSEDAAREFYDRYSVLSPGLVPLLIKIHGGDLADASESKLLDRLGAGDHLRRESVRRHVEAIRGDLLGPGGCSAVERLMVDRAVVCYLALQLAQEELRTWSDKRPQSFVQKRVDHAQKRFLEVLKALDHVRKKVPAVHLTQVKILGDLVVNSPPAMPVAEPARVIELPPPPEPDDPSPAPPSPTATVESVPLAIEPPAEASPRVIEGPAATDNLDDRTRRLVALVRAEGIDRAMREFDQDGLTPDERVQIRRLLRQLVPDAPERPAESLRGESLVADAADPRSA